MFRQQCVSRDGLLPANAGGRGLEDDGGTIPDDVEAGRSTSDSVLAHVVDQLQGVLGM